MDKHRAAEKIKAEEEWRKVATFEHEDEPRTSADKAEAAAKIEKMIQAATAWKAAERRREEEQKHKQQAEDEWREETNNEVSEAAEPRADCEEDVRKLKVVREGSPSADGPGVGDRRWTGEHGMGACAGVPVVRLKRLGRQVCVTRESVAAAALTWLPPACLAGYGDLSRESVAAAALIWLPPGCLAGYGDMAQRMFALRKLFGSLLNILMIDA